MIRILDFLLSFLGLIVLSPFFLLIALLIKISSSGPVLYKQSRIGLYGSEFNIYKFRSMRLNADKLGLITVGGRDPRVTPIGYYLRKYKLDELPQLINVLIGDMSLVGPRPERKFFVDQIVKIAPHYRHLHRVKPGITSWGQVKYGYAENVEQMVERLKFDILYIENRSIAVDVRILIYTVLTILQGRGR